MRYPFDEQPKGPRFQYVLVEPATPNRREQRRVLESGARNIYHKQLKAQCIGAIDFLNKTNMPYMSIKNNLPRLNNYGWFVLREEVK